MDVFNSNAALIFARLYDEFPSPIGLSPVSFLGEELGQPDEWGGLCEEAEAIRDALHWLYAEGFVRGQHHAYGLLSAVLTKKAFEVLQRVPEGLQASFGQRLKQSVKDGARGTMAELVRQVVASAIKAGVS